MEEGPALKKWTKSGSRAMASKMVARNVYSCEAEVEGAGNVRQGTVLIVAKQ